MKIFFIRFILFLVPFPVIWGAFVIIINPIYDRLYNLHSNDNSLFIWGDSQLHRGIEFEYLSTLTGSKVFSSSEHGSGVYDFIVFAEKVPEFSNVIISISKTAQLRRKSRDRNMAGISFSAINLLLENGYMWTDLFRIIAKNPRPISIFNSKNPLYRASEKGFKQSDLLLFETIYGSVPEYAKIKQAIYLEGLKILKEKKCKILFIDFPYHSRLRKIENNSEVKRITDGFTDTVLNELGVSPIQFKFHNLDTLMHDYTHLDEIGAKKVTQLVANYLQKFDKNIYLRIN